MVQAYNFLASWQLFPQKGEYEFGEYPEVGATYRIYSVENERLLSVRNGLGVFGKPGIFISLFLVAGWKNA